jgi:hypothetical protein
MTQAFGGVRVLVPASQVEAARRTITEFNAGSYQLEGEELPVATYSELPGPAFSPDRAVLLSFALTPVFGAAVQVANAWSLRVDKPRLSQWIWLVLLAVASATATAVLHRLSPGPLVVFRASLVLSSITVIWYFIAGQEQSRRLLATYGPKYAKKSLAKQSFIAAAVLLALGWALSEFA